MKKQITDYNYYRICFRKNFLYASDSFLYKYSENLILDILSDIKKRFHQPFIYGYTKDLEKYLKDFIQTSPIKIMEDQLEFLGKKDLIISNMTLHYVNDLKKAIFNYSQMLVKDGLLIINFLGKETLYELKSIFYKLDQEFFNGVNFRFIPLITIEGITSLLKSVGFTMPVIMSDNLEVHYRCIKDIFDDLKKLNLKNYQYNRAIDYLPKSYYNQIFNEYKSEFYDGSYYKTTFQIITIIASKDE